MSALDELGIAVQIRARPNEVDPAIPFADDHTRLLRPPRRAPVLASTRVGRPLWSRPEISRFFGIARHAT